MKKLFLLLLLPLSLNAQKNYPVLLDTYMQAAATVNNFNGNVLVAKSGNIIYQKSFGHKDKDAKYRLTNNSMFEIGLLTNQFTAASILLLKDRGKLKLTDTLRKFFPELPYSNITIHHLLTNTSGLPDYFFVMRNIWNKEKMATNDDVIRILAQTKPPVDFAAGQKWDWSPTGYVLLASIIEKLSGMTYNDFIEKNILKPLNLHNTKPLKGIPSLKANNAAFAEGIYSDNIPIEEAPDLMYAIAYGTSGDAGINSTTGDLFLWDRALKNHTLLTDASQTEMFSPIVLVDTSSQMFYGYSFNTGKNELGTYIMQTEPGASRLGYSANIIRYTDKDITIVVLCNNTKEFTSSKISGALSYILFEKEMVLPYVHKEITIDTSLLDNYVGKYALPNVVELIKKDGKLYRRMPGEPDEEFKPESTTKFFYDPAKSDIQYEFETDKNGKVIKAYIISSGLKKEIKKL